MLEAGQETGLFVAWGGSGAASLWGCVFASSCFLRREDTAVCPGSPNAEQNLMLRVVA